METSLSSIGLPGVVQESLTPGDSISLALKLGLFLAKASHPDRGGNPDSFKELQEIVTGLQNAPRIQNLGASNAFEEIESVVRKAENARNFRVDAARTCLDYVRALSTPNRDVALFCGPIRLELIDGFSALNHTTGNVCDLTLYETLGPGSAGGVRIFKRHAVVLEVDVAQDITIIRDSESSVAPFKRLIGGLKTKAIEEILSVAGLSRHNLIQEDDTGYLYETRRIPWGNFSRLVPFMTPIITSDTEGGGYLISVNWDPKNGCEPPYYTLEGLIRRIERL